MLLGDPNNTESNDYTDLLRHDDPNEKNDDEENFDHDGAIMRSNSHVTKIPYTRRPFFMLLAFLAVTLVAIVVVSYIMLFQNKPSVEKNAEIVNRCCACLRATEGATSQESCFCTPDVNEGQSSSIDFDLDDGKANNTIVELTISTDLCTLVQLAPSRSGFQPVARSYNGNPWEVSAGAFASSVVFTCPEIATDSSYCTAILPALPDGALYQLRSFLPLYRRPADTIARFLEQSTFGITQDGIASFQGDDSVLAMASWIQKQQYEIPITSHREFYRRRLNARKEFATVQGRVTHPCEEGARYRRYAFSDQDFGKNLTIEVQASNRTVLSVDGFVRTVISGPVTNDTDVLPSGTYTFYCYYWSTFVGGTIVADLSPDLITRLIFHNISGNPVVHFEPGIIDPSILLTIPLNSAIPIDSQYFEGQYEGFYEPVPEVILTSNLSDSICASIGPTGNPIQPAFAFFNNVYWIHDPRFETLDNTIESPAMDGGGVAVRETLNLLKPDEAAVCANVQRSFVNEEHCVLSHHTEACTPGEAAFSDDVLMLPLTTSNIRAFYERTGNGTDVSRFVYAINGLRASDDDTIDLPCERRSISRWIPVVCSGAADTLDAVVASIFAKLLSWSEDKNANMKDIYNYLDDECPTPLLNLKGFEVKDLNGKCWLNVHTDHLNVYDFTDWTLKHPGNSVLRSPIKEFAQSGLTTLNFPSNHTMDYWVSNKDLFPFVGRMDDLIQFVELPSELRTPETAAFFGFSPDDVVNEDSKGTLVCGSPFEVWNEPFLGGSQGRGAFDSVAGFESSKSLNGPIDLQKQIVWTHVILSAPDQLRQRIAWALAQILVVSPTAIGYGRVVTEEFLVYYDIFVRHAFGNYRDILKEVSYSPIMAEMLTYYRSQSTAHVWMANEVVNFADENYAREIMQLFTTGLTRLNPNGTQVIDAHGAPVHVYSNDDIMEYARVWTGFIAQPWRGNIESVLENRVDPMDIDMNFRDRLPKMGLDHKYIGDGYPLCADLPRKHFLKQGAVYRLLGSSSSPQLQVGDPPEWKTDVAVKHLELEAYGERSLFAVLCGSLNPSRCSFQAKVVLDEELGCTGVECSIDTIRTVKVADGIFYEYIRPPCVYEGFFDKAKTVVRRGISWDLTCADPRTEIGSAACCTADTREWNDKYWGERLTLASALERCAGEELCTRTTSPSCNVSDPAIGSYCLNYAHSWTNETCSTRVKIDSKGNVAIVHAPSETSAGDVNTHVREDTKTFFRVDWSGDVSVLIDDCNSTLSCRTSTDAMCVCDVAVSYDQLYFSESMPTRAEVLNTLHIGAFASTLKEFGEPSGSYDGVDWYSMNDHGNLTADSVFVVLDDAGLRQIRKNAHSTVSVPGTKFSFRNPVHFISLSEAEARDAHFETDAALDHYFYHPNTAPFLAIRFAQRFGISNPSPRFVEDISAAFRTGSYSFTSGSTTLEYGSGSYGDLAATIASVLLHPESRAVQLDMDPTHGSLREPLMKVIALMRSLKLELFENVPFVEFSTDVGSRIGQMAHAIPNVFSFFLPEYRPSGVIGAASLASPEAQVLTSPRVIELLNGLLSLIRYGLTSCYGGLNVGNSSDCADFHASEEDHRCQGSLRFQPSLLESRESVITELATLLTAGRLSNESRSVINRMLEGVSNLTEVAVNAQQMLVLTPEFHSTSLSTYTGITRRKPDPPELNPMPYKALVYVLLEGGVDSYNILVPHQCSEKNTNGMTLVDQYISERSILAFTASERSRIIDATGQPCSQFAIHQDLEVVERLYNEGDLAFFANAGVLNAPTDKNNYTYTTETYLFAHNTMQEEADRVDPFRFAPRTGVLGRLCDALSLQGYKTQPISVDVSTIATVGDPDTGRDRLFASRGGPTKFYSSREGEAFDLRETSEQLNGETLLYSGIFGETWSASLHKAMVDSTSIHDAVANVQIKTNFESDDYSQVLKTVATLIASHDQRGTDRDVFYVRFQGFDHHGNLKENLSGRLKEVNDALSAFVDEMKVQNVWDNVTVLITSDFGRTLTPNSGEGSDHGWGGHYFALGGSIRGGQIHGEYPPDITATSPQNIGRGRLIPTLSWESILNPVFNWMGVTTEEGLNDSLPNRHNTGTLLLQQVDLFMQ